MERNLIKIEAWVRRALRRKPNLIALPEMFGYRGSAKDLPSAAGQTARILKLFQDTARKNKTAILLGSLPEPSRFKNRFYNTSYLISEKGRLAAKYRKIHLFDIFLRGKVSAQESRHIVAGSRAVQGRLFGVPAGLTVCYDLRFPELFRLLVERGSRVIFVPSNFTATTGKAHWELLLRARAVENQIYIVAPAQVGVHPASRIRSFGTSLIVDPWGQVIGRGSRSREGMVSATLDLSLQKRLRKQFPVLSHRRI